MNQKVKDMFRHLYGICNEQIKCRLLYPDYFQKGREINKVCRGWSNVTQWKMFKIILSEYHIRNICVAGIYQGQDIGYIAAIAQELGIQNYHITGIDKFEDSYCADWPQEIRGKSWESAGFGKAPQLEAAISNIKKLRIHKHVTLVKSDDGRFFRNTREQFDFIYIDTSHDYKSVRNLIRLGIKKCKPGGVIGGDDYAHKSMWGVIEAVNESFRKFKLVNNYVWYANREDYIKSQDDRKSIRQRSPFRSPVK